MRLKELLLKRNCALRRGGDCGFSAYATSAATACAAHVELKDCSGTGGRLPASDVRDAGMGSSAADLKRPERAARQYSAMSGASLSILDAQKNTRLPGTAAPPPR